MAGKRTAGRRGAAGPGRTGCRRVGPPRKQPSSLPSKPSTASQTSVLNVFSEARTNDISCKPMGDINGRLTHGFSAGRKTALRSWLLTNGPTPMCLCKPFSCKACPGKRKPRNALHEKAYRNTKASVHWSNRDPISIFGPIFKVENRAEDPNLRQAERTWRGLVKEGGV